MKPGKPTTCYLDANSFSDDEARAKNDGPSRCPASCLCAHTASLLVVPCLKRLQGVHALPVTVELPVTLSSQNFGRRAARFHRVALSLRGGDGNAEPYRVRHSGEIVAARRACAVVRLLVRARTRWPACPSGAARARAPGRARARGGCS